ncbi:MAG TPA: enoyl-CoA hydratase/isomerase family protein [Thermoanaerobaculia bacterium]|jgi:enoyl-CoA hydratase
MIDRTNADGVVTLRLNHGKVAALDLELIDAMALAFHELVDSDARAVVLTGTGKSFSAGVDLFRVVDGGTDYVDRFFPALSRFMLDLYAFPKPLIVAANGHAIAGGCIFTLCGDYRLMAAGDGRIGIPELLVGVPFPASVLEVIRDRVPSHHLEALMFTGRTVKPDEALRLGIVDEVTDDLPSRTDTLSRQFAALPQDAFRLAKRQLRDRTITHAKHYANELDGAAHDLWRAPETHARIREYLARTIKK